MEQLGVAAAGCFLLGLSTLAYLQMRKALPERANALALGAVAVFAAATVVAALRGYGPIMWTAAPAGILAAAFIASKGSLPVLLEGLGTDEDAPSETEAARTRLAVLLLGAFVLGFIVYLFI